MPKIETMYILSTKPMHGNNDFSCISTACIKNLFFFKKIFIDTKVFVSKHIYKTIHCYLVIGNGCMLFMIYFSCQLAVVMWLHDFSFYKKVNFNIDLLYTKTIHNFFYCVCVCS